MKRQIGIVPWRLTATGVFFIASTLGLVVRLGQLQILEQETFRQQAREEHWSRQSILAHRGVIRDRNGHPLATTVTTYTILVDVSSPKKPETLARTVRALSTSLGLSPEEMTAKVSQQKDGMVLLKADVPYDVGNNVSELGLPGVETIKVTKRVYPEGSLAASLLGFVGKDNVGLTGIERDFNRELAGINGTILFERDSIGNPIPLGFRQLTPPQDGADLILTLDRYIQRLVEKELDKAIAKHKASGGTIIVMEPATGAILAMATRPTFNLNELNLQDSSKMELYRNRAITDLYEPGSVFKVITMAAALDERLVTPDSTFYDSGKVVKNGWTITNWNGQANGLITMTQVLQRSANVGAIWISDLLGPDRFYKYVRRFGFGQPTNIGLSGEANGQVRTQADKGWSPVDLATNSFGQGISITPLQMVTAIGAVANGGNLMQPLIVKEVIGPDERKAYQPVVVRRVISPETSRLMVEMMNATVEKVENKLAMVPGYHVSGKTGTASIPLIGYTSSKTIASFVGFAPTDNPRIVVLVRIDEPTDTPWGSLVASPLFSSIARQILTYLKVPPSEPVLALNRN